MTTGAGASTWKVPVGTDQTTVAFDPAESGRGVLLVCAHGAGGQMNDRSLVAVTRSLRARGIDTVRFNFLYRERGSGRPDLMPRLIECFAAVIASVRERVQPATLLLGGRSMGGRAASMMERATI